MSYEFIRSLENQQDYTFPDDAQGLESLGIKPRAMSGLALDYLRVFREGGEGELAGP
jgi:hypothetical protein